MRYGLPTWLTSDNGSEFAGAFRHQLERFGIEHVTTSAYHPQSNGAAERLVATIKSMLAAKVAGAVHNWPALLPQIRMECMQRVHTTTSYSPNRLVFCTTPRLPPPVGALRWDARAASVVVAASTSAPPSSESTPDFYLAFRDETSTTLLSTAYDRILARQQVHACQQRARRERRRKGGKRLVVGDLAYLLTRTGGFKPDVKGQFVVVAISDTRVSLRTTALVEGQASKTFEVDKHLDRVARATTKTDVLEDLLKHAQIVKESPPQDPDIVAAQDIQRRYP
jgi:hypothetical protein